METEEIAPEEENSGLHSALTNRSDIVEVEIIVVIKDPETKKIKSTEKYMCEPNTGYHQLITKQLHSSGHKQTLIQVEGLLVDRQTRDE